MISLLAGMGAGRDVLRNCPNPARNRSFYFSVSVSSSMA